MGFQDCAADARANLTALQRKSPNDGDLAYLHVHPEDGDGALLVQ